MPKTAVFTEHLQTYAADDDSTIQCCNNYVLVAVFRCWDHSFTAWRHKLTANCQKKFPQNCVLSLYFASLKGVTITVSRVYRRPT